LTPNTLKISKRKNLGLIILQMVKEAEKLLFIYSYNILKDVNFIGYTFKRDIENERSGLISALESLEKIK